MTAVISECGRYRYTLSRRTDCPLRWIKHACWIMLNPSTADATIDDPTIRRVKAFSASWGFTNVTVVNLYALRATDPQELWTADVDPIGPENNQHILAAARAANQIICAWGKPGPEQTRPSQVRGMLEELAGDLYWLKLNKDGSPGHPLYLPKSLTPQLWS